MGCWRAIVGRYCQHVAQCSTGGYAHLGVHLGGLTKFSAVDNAVVIAVFHNRDCRRRYCGVQQCAVAGLRRHVAVCIGQCGSYRYRAAFGRLVIGQANLACIQVRLHQRMRDRRAIVGRDRQHIAHSSAGGHVHFCVHLGVCTQFHLIDGAIVVAVFHNRHCRCRYSGVQRCAVIGDWSRNIAVRIGQCCRHRNRAPLFGLVVAEGDLACIQIRLHQCVACWRAIVGRHRQHVAHSSASGHAHICMHLGGFTNLGPVDSTVVVAVFNNRDRGCRHQGVQHCAVAGLRRQVAMHIGQRYRHSNRAAFGRLVIGEANLASIQVRLYQGVRNWRSIVGRHRQHISHSCSGRHTYIGMDLGRLTNFSTVDNTVVIAVFNNRDCRCGSRGVQHCAVAGGRIRNIAKSIGNGCRHGDRATLSRLVEFKGHFAIHKISSSHYVGR